MGNANKFITDHDFYCTRCGRKGIPVCRHGRMREPGHLKKLFCINCQEEINHVECVSASKYTVEDFLKEYENSNFTIDGTRILSLSEWKCKQKEENELESIVENEELTIDEWMELFNEI
ncbi:MAG: hypothetical protein MJ133_10330 [Lachnospiraceae bacterium]|nr:hypothetical protein [Lachnospiraceae bacterium]